MRNFEFWGAIDKLLSQSEIVIDRPKSSRHPNYNYIYEVDYGYLKNTSSMDGGGIDIWVGTSASKAVDAIICTVDLLKKDSEIKLVFACTDEEKRVIYQFHNESEFMKGVLIKRPQEHSKK